ncbi:glycosyltransferase [Desulfosoma sp.]|uniref:glycosyltransferase n=1 Tax=Desulfosoma sp. TaxID=2603217 RepID=UPI0040495EE5
MKARLMANLSRRSFSAHHARPIRRLVAVVVNYHSAELTVRAVHSILTSDDAVSVDVVVVDNSTSSQEAALLKKTLPDSVHLMISPHNLGFGQACNMAWEKRPADALLLLNPDAYLTEQCLQHLVRALNMDPRVGAVGPKIYWDPKKQFLLPPSVPPSWILMLSAADRLGDPAIPFLRFLGKKWRRDALGAWQAGAPFPVKNLSGGSVLIRSDAIRDVGGLFDPGFFLYFEDTDLFRRMTRRGWRLLVEPRAAVVHEFDQCGMESLPNKRQFMADSHAIFLRKHFSWYSCCLRWIPQGPRNRLERLTHGASNRTYRRPFRIRVPEEMPRPWLFEWSPSVHFIPAAAAFGTGAYAEFSEDAFRRLAPGRYFGRIGPAAGFKPFNSLSFSFIVTERTSFV